MTSTAIARAFVLNSPKDACEIVDELENESGELLIRDAARDPSGSIFIERGRVCWAAAVGLNQRLGDLLAARARVDRNEMSRLYTACRVAKKPLGEFLVESGVVSSIDLRSALLQHTAESLSVLCERRAFASWIPRSPGSYSARFTFRTTEVLAYCLATQFPDVAENAERELARSFGEGDWGAAFVRSPARAVPEPIALCGHPPTSTSALIRLGIWAVSALDVARTFQSRDVFIATTREESAFVAWETSAAIVVGQTNLQGPGRLLNMRSQRRRRGESNGGLRS